MEIYNATNISISLSTLRRIFKNDFNGYPQISTLDAFAKYLGYNDWYAYQKNNEISNVSFVDDEKGRFKINSKTVLLILGIMLFAGGSYAIYKLISSSKTNLNNIEFSYRSFKRIFRSCPYFIDRLYRYYLSH